MIDEPPIRLEAAAERDAPVLANLLELYIHDLSEIFEFDVRPDGRFGYDRLPSYWREPERRFPFLIRVGGELAGFALVTRGSPATEDPADLDVAEFFVLRRYRRRGVGRQAAHALWDRLTGSWVVRVADRNDRGRAFWEPVVSAYTGGRFCVKRAPGRGHEWIVYRFTTRREAGAAS
jgi:predicted acetyltransferase